MKGCTVFSQMEEERLIQLKNLAEQYHETMSQNRPKLVSCSQRLQEPIQTCDITADMEAIHKRVIIQTSLADLVTHQAPCRVVACFRFSD